MLEKAGVANLVKRTKVLVELNRMSTAARILLILKESLMSEDASPFKFWAVNVRRYKVPFICIDSTTIIVNRLVVVN